MGSRLIFDRDRLSVDVTTFSEVDAVEYARLADELRRLPENYDITAWRQPWRVVRTMLLWVVLWLGAIGLVVLVATQTAYRGPTGGYGVPLPVLLLGLAVLVVGAAFPWVWAARDNRRITAMRDVPRRAIDDLVERATRQRHREGDFGASDGLTLRQSQHAWYRGHSELNWRHREQGQALGFDNADDYVNNFLESE